MTGYWCERAWLPDGVAEGVRVEVAGAEIVSVTPNAPRTGTVLPGLTLPGFANGHSHAFHRALRGRTHHGKGTFWTWRERMYSLAGRLDPDGYYRLARGVYAEMVLAGYTAVGEFHYLHHAPGGKPYADPDAMSHALVAAAGDAGIRITLLDTCYLAGGIGEPLSPVQQRFSDGDAEAWAARAGAFLPSGRHALAGAAVHSVRAVPRDQLPTVGAWDGPLHVHLSEQPAENEACLAHYGRTPTELLADAGVLGERTVAVHATHLSDTDIGTLGESRTGVCFCPTTERDLGDGIGPAGRLLDAGVPLCLGSDSNAVVDPFEEARALEMNERLARRARGRFTPGQLLDAATGHSAIGWRNAGWIGEGALADLVTVRMPTVRTAGIEPDGVLLAAAASDVHTVLAGGRLVVREGRHREIDPARVLAEEIEELWA
ncbi:formimidoylglutamate deiminase [Amycolatopsis nigrescens]|uniref:formimidoylglutamate deiminase n=1 Tax=Amycolatopsis nigrescens TaxID=381445 RepID=UPI0003681BB6|nr:formimidoylglutamate deiminase [Amycolatopsis nigrescens]